MSTFWNDTFSAAFSYADALGLVVRRSGATYTWSLPASELAVDSSNIYYVDPDAADDTGDGTEGDPFKLINTAVAAANTATLDDVIIRIVAGTYKLAAKWTTAPNMPCMVEGWGGTTTIGRFVEASAGTWSLSGTNYYNSTFADLGLASSSGVAVFDTANPTADGQPIGYTEAADNTENDAIEGSFRPGSSSINLHAVGGGEPGAGIWIADTTKTIIDVAATEKLVIRNLTAHGTVDLRGSAGAIRLVDFLHRGGGPTGDAEKNGIYIGHTGAPNAVLVRVESAGNMGDAANYESTTNIIELDCTFANSGYTDAVSDNGSTAHNDVAIISVNPTVTNCLRNVHDVQDSRRVLINPTINTSRGASVQGESVNLMVGLPVGGDDTQTWLIDGDVSGGSLDDIVVNGGGTLRYFYDEYDALAVENSGTITAISENPIATTSTLRRGKLSGIIGQPLRGRL